MELDEETNTLVQQALNDILDTQNIQNWGSLSYERIRNSGYPVRYKLYYKENDFFPLIIRLEDFVVNITPPEVVTQQPQRILFKVGEEGIFRTSYKINQGEEFVVEIGETNSDGKVAIGKIRRPTNLPINILRKSIINYPECYELAKAATKPAPWPVIQILTGIFTPEDISIDEKTSIIKLTLPDIIEIESHLGTGFESGKPLLHNRITHIVGLKVSGLNEINYFKT